jgi:hypothetical protein
MKFNTTFWQVRPVVWSWLKEWRATKGDIEVAFPRLLGADQGLLPASMHLHEIAKRGLRSALRT